MDRAGGGDKGFWEDGGGWGEEDLLETLLLDPGDMELSLGIMLDTLNFVKEFTGLYNECREEGGLGTVNLRPMDA